MHQHSSEKGQALIIITFAAVILFGFAALAIDGSMVFSDKRHAQNAADTSAWQAPLPTPGTVMPTTMTMMTTMAAV